MTDTQHLAACLAAMIAWQSGWFALCLYLINRMKIP